VSGIFRAHADGRAPGWRRRRRIVAGLVAVSLVAGAACGDDDDEAEAGDGGQEGAAEPANGGEDSGGEGGFALPEELEGDAPESLTIGLTGAYALNFLPVIVAEGAGYFDAIDERFGTDISFQTYGGGVDAQAAFAGGEVPMLVIAPASYTASVLQGEDQISIFNQEVGLGIVASARKDLEEEYGTDIENFADANWCQIGPVGTSNTAAKLLSAAAGLDPDSIEIFSTGSVAAVVPSLQSGQCDIVTGDINSAATGILQDVAYVAANPWVPCDTIPLMGEQVGIPLTTSREFTDQYPELTTAVVAASLWGLRVVQESRDDPEALYEMLPEEMTAELPFETFEAAMELAAPAFDPLTNDGRFTEQTVFDTLWNLQAVELVPRDATVDPSLIFTNEFVNEAYELLGLDPLETVPGDMPEEFPTELGPPSDEAAGAWETLVGEEVDSAGPSAIGDTAC
jgi:ABC-type nitrate/sulfonate/bicarbonate transport system substrate-binding protein